MTSAFATIAGAVVPEGEGAPAHFGNPLGEQRRLAEGRAIVHRGDRGVLTLTGPDRLTWLNSITSQSLSNLAPGQSTETLILDPQGHIEHQAAIFEDGETAWLIVDRADAEPLRAWLLRMRFTLRVEIVDASEDWAVVGWMDSPDSPARAVVLAAVAASAGAGDDAAALPPIWADPWAAVTPGGYQYAGAEHPATEWSWAEAIVSPAALARIAGALQTPGADASAAGTLAAEALRIEAWRPSWSHEVDEKALPHESDWLRSAVHLNKGCYRGQETVAKVHNLGHPPRRLVMLHLDGSESTLPAVGADVTRASTRDDEGAVVPGAVVGRVTSVTLHHELGPVALAVIKRSAPMDETLEVAVEHGYIAGNQEVIVPADAGATANIPRMPRLGARARRETPASA